jgi:hypothetical protein
MAATDHLDAHAELAGSMRREPAREQKGKIERERHTHSAGEGERERER